MNLSSSEKRSAIAIVAASTLTRIGDTFTNPKTVLSWLLSALGAPAFIIGMLVPIRESGSMLPQIALSSFLKKFRRRKKVYLAGLFGQALCVAAIGCAALFLDSQAAGFSILGAVTLFSLARALCSMSSKDVLGRAIPKGNRGQISGIASTLSGILAATAAIALLLNREAQDSQILAYLILGASLLWLLAAAAYTFVSEPVPDEEPEENSFVEGLKERLTLVKDDRFFRNFILARTLLLGSALASPFIVVIAQRSGSASLASFIIAAAIASFTSSFIWGKLSDKASHLAMAFGGGFAFLIGAAAIACHLWIPSLSTLSFFWPTVFLLFNMGYTGVRLGRKTWVVDAAKGDQRTDYVSAANTVIALFILAFGLITAPLQSVSPILPLGLYSITCGAGALFALKLKLPSTQE